MLGSYKLRAFENIIFHMDFKKFDYFLCVQDKLILNSPLLTPFKLKGVSNGLPPYTGSYMIKEVLEKSY